MDAPTRELFYPELLKDQEKHPRMMIVSTHVVSEMDNLFDEILIPDKILESKKYLNDKIVRFESKKEKNY